MKARIKSLLQHTPFEDPCFEGHDPMRSPSIHTFEDGQEGMVQFCRRCRAPVFHPFEKVEVTFAGYVPRPPLIIVEADRDYDSPHR